MKISVFIPTHAPHEERLRRTLQGLRAQTLPVSEWETVLVDNASARPIDVTRFASDAPVNLRVVSEPALGLSHARLRGFAETESPVIVMVDDDNVLAPDYLSKALEFLHAYPRVGAVGGRVLPEFAISPAPWLKPFDGLLALRDLGDEIIVANRRKDPTGIWEYPLCAPIGAGMVVRREALQLWLSAGASGITDRRGGELTSGGDNDMVFSMLEAGWQVAYLPGLSLIHLIPEGRMTEGYLCRLNRGIQKSWMDVLRRHGANPWPVIPRWTVPFRKVKAWLALRAWSSPERRIRWSGICGQLEGLALPWPR